MSSIIETFGINWRRGWGRGGRNGKPFPAIAGKVHAVVLGKQIAQCFSLGPEVGEGREICSVYSAFWVSKGQMTWFGTLGKEFLNTYYFKTCGFASRHLEAPVSCTRYECVNQ